MTLRARRVPSLSTWLLAAGAITIMTQLNWLDPNWRHQLSNALIAYVVLGIIAVMVTIGWFGLRQVPKLSLAGTIAVCALLGAILGGGLGVAVWVVKHQRPAQATETASTNDAINATRRELYAEMASLRTRRTALYNEGFIQHLGIESLIGDLERLRGKKDVRALSADIDRRVRDHETTWMREKTENDAALNGLLARIRTSFPLTEELEQRIARVRVPWVDGELLAPADEEAARQWVKDTNKAFNERFVRDFARPLEELERYLGEQVGAKP